jgi:hypothetical protein
MRGARLHFEEMQALAPDSFTSRFEPGIADEYLRLLEEAREYLQTACRIALHSESCARELKTLERKMK